MLVQAASQILISRCFCHSVSRLPPPGSSAPKTCSTAAMQQSMYHCGVVAASSSFSPSIICPQCREVPEGDINSTRSHWICTCGQCWVQHTAADGVCKQRQLKRAIVRLASVCYCLTSQVREVTFPLGVEGCWRLEHEDSSTRGYVFLVRAPEVIAAPRSRFPDNMPESIKKRAVAYENCVGAVCCMTPAMAWLTEGT